ncbi:MAG: hypothetical protein QM747_07340 [Nocardioides sp.]
MREAVGATATALLLLGLTACGGHSGSDAGSSPRSSAPTTAPVAPTPTLKPHHYRAIHVDAGTRRASVTSTHAYVVGSMRLLASPDSKATPETSIAGTALQSLLAMRREYASNHYRVVGRPEVVSQKVIKRQSDPERLVVAACLDNSAVKVLDKNGHRVKSSQGPQRVMNILTLTRRGGSWVVTGQDLPANPTC